MKPWRLGRRGTLGRVHGQSLMYPTWKAFSLRPGVAEHVPSAGTSTRAYGLEGLDRWKPSHLTWNVGEASMLTIVPDKQPCGTSMSNEMQSFREKVDEAFGWQGKVLDQRRKDFRAAAQAALLLLGWGRW